MQENAYLNILKPIHYNNEINVLYLTPELYNEKDIPNMIYKNIQKKQIHQIMKNRKKTKLISLLLNNNNSCEQIFITFSNFDFSIYEDEYSEYYALAKYIYHDVIHNFLHNKIDIAEYIMGITYQYKYIKKSPKKGEKQLVPLSTVSNNKMNLK